MWLLGISIIAVIVEALGGVLAERLETHLPVGLIGILALGLGLFIFLGLSHYLEE